MDSALTRRRRHRATVAEVLLKVHQSAGLESPAQWDWQSLAAIPQWCLLEPKDRARLQAVCGALVLGPKLLRCVHGCALRGAGELIGERLFRAILTQSQKLELDTSGQAIDEAPPPETAAQACAQLLAQGAGVLSATLPEQFATESMIASLGDCSGKVRPDTAAVLLSQAQEMIHRHPEEDQLEEQKPEEQHPEGQQEQPL